MKKLRNLLLGGILVIASGVALAVNTCNPNPSDYTYIYNQTNSSLNKVVGDDNFPSSVIMQGKAPYTKPQVGGAVVKYSFKDNKGKAITCTFVFPKNMQAKDWCWNIKATPSPYCFNETGALYASPTPKR